MNILERLRDLLEADTPPSAEEIAERRREVKAEIGELEARVQKLDSPRGRTELLEEAGTVEELGERKREARDRLEGLRDLDRELAARQQKAELAARQAELVDTVAELPALADRFEEAEAALREAREELEAALVETARIRVRLERERGSVAVHLNTEAVDRLEEIVDRLPANVDVSHLRAPEAPDPDRPIMVYDVAAGVRRWVGDWSQAPPRAGTPRHAREVGWTEDMSEATGIPPQHRRRRVVSKGIG